MAYFRPFFSQKTRELGKFIFVKPHSETYIISFNMNQLVILTLPFLIPSLLRFFHDLHKIRGYHEISFPTAGFSSKNTV